MLDNVGLIHMNGRVYDPTLARFLSVDPINQAPDNAQSYNPYSYVFNSPMMFTDPSGFSAWTKYRRPVVGIAASVLTYGMATYAATGVWFADGVANVGLAKFGASVLAGGVGGGIQSGTVEGALKGAVMAAAFYGVGSGAEQIASAGGAQNAIAARTFQVAGHAAVACAGAVASGGQCGPAALAQGFTSGVSPYLPDGYLAGTIAHAGVGAMAAKLAGGDARQGAFTAAYAHLFNDLMHITGEQKPGSYNIFGHTAVAVEGAGVYSYGNDTPLGSDVLQYINDQSKMRDQWVTIVPRSVAQDEGALRYLASKPGMNSVNLIDTCAVRSDGAVRAAGLTVSKVSWLPEATRNEAMSQPGASTFFIPKGGVIPQGLIDTARRFNPKGMIP